MALEQTITEAADKLLHAVEVYGPKATDLVLETGRVAAFQTIVAGFVFLWMLFLILYCMWCCCLRMQSYKDDNISDGPLAWGAAIGVLGLVGVVCLIGSLINLLNIFAWVGLWRPELYLASRALNF